MPAAPPGRCLVRELWEAKALPALHVWYPPPKGHPKGDRRKIRAAPPTKHGARRPVACGGEIRTHGGPCAPNSAPQASSPAARCGKDVQVASPAFYVCMHPPLPVARRAPSRGPTGNLGMLDEPAAYLIRRPLIPSCFQGRGENSKGRLPVLSVTPRPFSFAYDAAPVLPLFGVGCDR